ncbi:MAG: TolC family protein [Chlorobi bacterium]|nr:TolC family protein [Chlorobiota bacterium]
MYISRLYSGIIFAGLYLSLTFTAYPQSTVNLTLEQCIDTVQQRSFLLHAEAFNSEATKSYALVSHTRTLPWVSAEAGMENRFLSPYNFGQQWATIHGDWSLGDFILKTDAPARQEVITAQYQQEKTRLDAIGRVSALYMSIIQKQTERSLLSHQLSLLQKHRSLTESLWKAGLRTQIDVLRTEAEISGIEETINHTVTEEDKLRIELARLLGLKPVDTLLLKRLSAEKLVYDIAVPPADTVLLSGNPMIKILESEIEVSKLSSRLISARQWPHLFIGSGYFGDHDPTGDGNYWLINAGISIPIYRFGSIKYQQQESNARTRVLDYRLYDLYRELSIHQQQVLEHMKKIKELMTIQEKRLETAQQALELAATNYQAGLITNLEYLTLQQQVTNTGIHIEEVRLEYIMYLIEYYLTNNQVDKIIHLGIYSISKN